MAKYLTEAGRDFRKLVSFHEGEQRVIAETLNISVPAVSTRLNSELHGAWWRAFKKRRARQRRAERQRRWRENAKARMKAMYGDDL